MKVYTMLSDSSLIQKLETVEGIESVTPVSLQSSGQLKLDPTDLFILSDERIHIDMLSELRELYPDCRILYLISNSDESLSRKRMICQMNNIHFIMPFQSEGNIIAKIEEWFFNRKRQESGVIAFFSGLPQQGVTSSILSISKAISEQSVAKIGIIGFNCFSSGSFELMNYKGKTFDELWGLLTSKQLTEEDLLSHANKLADNLFYLGGSRLRKKTYFYEPDGVEHLCSVARRAFDIVLLDIGANFDNAVAAMGMYVANTHVLVMTQLNTHIQAFEEQYEQIILPHFGIERSDILVLFNKVQDGEALLSPNEIKKEMGFRHKFGEIPYIPNHYLRVQKLDPFLQLSGFDKYNKSVNRIAKAIIDMYELPLIPDETSKKRFFTRVFSLGRG